MGKKLYVGGLSYQTTQDQLTEHFSQAGVVTSAMIITDRETGNSKGFGFVEMATDEEAAKAIEMFNEQEFDGRKLTVNEARPKEERPAGGQRFEQRGGGNWSR